MINYGYSPPFKIVSNRMIRIKSLSTLPQSPIINFHAGPSDLSRHS